MPSSTLPAAFSTRQSLAHSSLTRIKYPTPTIMAPQLPPHPSSVRHRLRAVLPETLKDTEAEPLSIDPLSIDQDILSPHNNTAATSSHTWHQPRPILQKLLSQGMPAESVLLLNIVAVIWGSQHPVIKMVVDDCDPSSFTLVRFCLAAIIASVFSDSSLLWNTNTSDGNEEDGSDSAPSKAKLTWRWGAEMGLWMFLGYAFQSIGLEVSESVPCHLVMFSESQGPFILTHRHTTQYQSCSTRQRNDLVSSCILM